LLLGDEVAGLRAGVHAEVGGLLGVVVLAAVAGVGGSAGVRHFVVLVRCCKTGKTLTLNSRNVLVCQSTSLGDVLEVFHFHIKTSQ